MTSSAEPKTAAACILVRGDGEPKVLLAKRNPALRFMGGHHVFPGGRIKQDESVRRVANATNEVVARAIQAATREVFEETGLLCVRGALPPREQLQQARRDLLKESATFNDLLAQQLSR
ncbi:MAG: NUDIX hydrolase [Pirellulales bacterium]|nr:NUDIX hydrolase [Pirellulales bacterium]